MENAIEALQLEKTFVKKRSFPDLLTRPFRKADRVRALKGVTLSVRRGEIFGLLGPNGAGKTTLVKILSCLVLPDRGRAVVDGHETVHESRVKPSIGLVHSDERSFYWRLSGIENLRFFATLYNVPPAAARTRIDELLRRVDLVEAADQRFSDYSSGMKQRLAVARALLHDPPILLMDEPTRSLDPASARSLRRFVQEDLQRRDGKTIVLATHNLYEAEVLCDRIAILAGGRIRQTGTVEDVRRWGVKEHRFRLDVDRWPDDVPGPFAVVKREKVETGERIVVTLNDGARLDDLLRPVIAAGSAVLGCDRVESDLEEAFARVIAAEDDGDA